MILITTLMTKRKVVFFLAGWQHVRNPRWGGHSKREEVAGQSVHSWCTLQWETTHKQLWRETILVTVLQHWQDTCDKEGWL